MSPTRTAGRRRKRRLVLVVEDDPYMRAAMRRLLETMGHVVVAIGSVSEAVAAHQRLVPDLAIIDVCIGTADGEALGELLRQRQPELPILYVSGKAGGPTLGPRERFLAKPFSGHDLEAMLRALLDANGGSA